MEADGREVAFQSWLQRQLGKKRRELGVSFRGLECHGFTSSATFQHTVASYALVLPRLLLRLLSGRSASKLQILHDFNGLVRPGEMLLVLGRPGSGCSSFLKVLSGETYGIHVGQATEVNYSGISYDQLHRDFKGESIYLAELDVHFPELSLGETLTFAAASREGSAADAADATRANARDVAAMFGLLASFDTKMGNAMIRGVSGGEKRRTSIGEALTSNASLQCWDNSTRGLDSATAQRFIELLRSLTNDLRSTAIMSIYQASDPMYNQFDKVTLLYEGRQIYFGPVGSAATYFQELGFEKPERATIADFLTSLTNPAERVIRDGHEDRVPRSAEEFANTWNQSPEARKLIEEIDAFDVAHPLEKKGQTGLAQRSKLSDERSSRLSNTYSIPIQRQILICVQRGFLRLRNNYVPAVSAVFANAILAIVVGSVFLNLPNTAEGMDRRAILIFFSLMICAFSPAFEVSTMWAQRPIVEKHNRYAMYHPWAEALASYICDLPAKLGTSVMFHITLYFMTNLRRTASAFFTHLVFMFFIVLTMSMVFRTLGSLSRTLEQTMAPASIVVLLCIMYTGFVIPVPYMKPWLSWFRRLNPMAYAYESLMINEFRGRSFPCSSTIPTGPGYSEQPGLSGKVCPVVGSQPGEPDVQGSSYLLLKYGYDPSHLWMNFGIIIAMLVIFGTAHLLAAEYIPAQRSKGEVLLFQHGHHEKKPSDAENAEKLPGLSGEVGRRKESKEYNVPFKTTQNLLRQSSVFHWSNLSYHVKTKDGMRTILNSIDGWVKPGEMTALMGVTGAGKTTLLDVLANRARFGKATGNICIDSMPRDRSFQRKIGYVQQEDNHLHTTTVREALEFSALLRQSDGSSREDKLNYVDSVIQVLEMESYAQAVVGVPGNGLNIEQRKRLSIGVELAAKPELMLFLDEPTSGLDSQTAWSICQLLRKLADQGQAVFCTIHQPSSQIFQTFDRLLLLNDHGEVAYFGDIGEDASLLIDYFESKGAPRCQAGANPAEWVLSAVSSVRPEPPAQNASDTVKQTLVEQVQHDNVSSWSKKWAESQQHREIQQHNLRLSSTVGEPVSPNMPSSRLGGSEYATSFPQQLYTVTKRIFLEYWRDPTYIYSKLALCWGVCFFNGISVLNTALDMQGFINFLFSIFLITQLFSTLDQQMIPRLVDGRNLFESREGRTKAYSWTVFIASNIIVELCWQTVASIIIFVSWYYPTRLWENGDASFGMSERGGLVFLLIWLFCLWITTFSHAVGIGIEHAETAVQIATLCFWLSLVFCGVLVSPNDLPDFWIFVYRASPLTYFINGMVVATLANTQISCSDVQLLHIDPPSHVSSNVTCGDYLAPFVQFAGGTIVNSESTMDCQYCPVSESNRLLQQLGMETLHPWHNAGYMTVYVIFNTLAVYAIYWLFRVAKARKREQEL